MKNLYYSALHNIAFWFSGYDVAHDEIIVSDFLKELEQKQQEFITQMGYDCEVKTYVAGCTSEDPTFRIYYTEHVYHCPNGFVEINRGMWDYCVELADTTANLRYERAT